MKKLKVLIVDDSAVMRKIVERALRQAGLDLGEVLEASNGAEALVEVQKGALDIILSELPTMANPLGVKGSGQAGAIAAPQTIVNAILDALGPLGVDHLDMPATPEQVWRAIRAASVPADRAANGN